jgi:heme A synthase
MDQQQPGESSRTLFFARCPPTLPHHELLQLFAKFGHITSFNLYRRWAKAKNSKGCGTVVYADKASAAAALAALDGKQQWPESETPMVVEWAQASKIRNQAPAMEAPAGEAVLHQLLHHLLHCLLLFWACTTCISCWLVLDRWHLIIACLLHLSRSKAAMSCITCAAGNAYL